MPRTHAAAASTEAQALAGVIDRYIQQRGWSIRRASREWGMNDSTIGKIINTPSRVPEPPTMRKLAVGMGMSLGDLYRLCGMGDPPDVEEADRQLVEAAIHGLSKSDLETLSQIPPEKKAMLLDMARAFLSE